MMTYDTSPLKQKRRTKNQIEQLRSQILDVLSQDYPQSVRHIFYRMTDPTLPEPVEKSEKGYTTVQRQITKMRRDGSLPYGWITDMSRSGWFVDTYSSPSNFFDEVAHLYRRDIWKQCEHHVEIWCESRSIAGVINNVAFEYRVPLYPTSGFSSLTLAFEAAKNMDLEADGRPIRILYIGDYDPAGLLIDQSLEKELRKHLSAPQQLFFERLAVTEEQINLMSLPTKPPKETRGGWNKDTGTVEAESIPAGKLRAMLERELNAYTDTAEIRAIMVAEESERELVRGIQAFLD